MIASAVRFLLKELAERVGFEPTVPCGITGFQDRLLKPLGHLSAFAAILSSMLQTVKRHVTFTLTMPSSTLNFSITSTLRASP